MISNWGPALIRTFRGTSAPMTYALIALCCLIFVLGPASGFVPSYGTGDALLATQRAYFRRWGVVPADLFGHPAREALTPVTALFIHGSWIHLLGNMLFLYVFGAMTEERLGRVEFTLFYLVCGYLALLGYAVANAGSEQSLVGASGAISGIRSTLVLMRTIAVITAGSLPRGPLLGRPQL